VAKINWQKVKNEYLRGGISQRDLARKYGISFNTLKDRANKEKWNGERNRITTKTQQKTAEKVSDIQSEANAVKANIERGALMLCNNLLAQIALQAGKSGLKPAEINTLTAAIRNILENTGVSALQKLKTRDIELREYEVRKRHPDGENDDNGVLDGILAELKGGGGENT